MKVKSKRKMAGILAAVLIALVLLTFDCINGDPISERWAMHRAIQFAEKLYPDQTFTAENAGSMRGFCYTVNVQSQQSRDTRFYVETSFWLFTSDTHTVDHTQYVDPRLNTTHFTSSVMECTNSVFSFVGFVSSKRRLNFPPYSFARPEFKMIDFACPI